ncbi:homogentisate 1,2-dioxygenase [Nocardia nova]|uniref:Homogentisate 1,2-dioxygenase n=1 Tax=Nocardia nova TaxID=37330 RepID=A0A2S6AN70_9NOCA|nr:homogentisate 1,2-dioxygenase domain-containing protein [Nocardia nova]PPJ25705.1 homogentisate 1,2-dioxygenase [Nocardia nova]PPJ36668.1 homogentisate 1,2-dioxygenase [Nocardia nova]
MTYYRKVGDVPAKRHTLHHGVDGDPLFEEFIGEEGFSGTGSLLYHRFVPSAIVDAYSWDVGDTSLTANTPLRPRHFRPDPDDAHTVGKDLVRGRHLLLGNNDVLISRVVADVPSPLYCNGIGDELVFVAEGSARLESVFGALDIRQGDNVVVPRATIHRWIPTEGRLHAIVVEGSGHVQPARRYRSDLGQFLEGAPMTERDLRVPDGPLLVSDELQREFTEVYVKHRDRDGVAGTVMVRDHHPFDVVGWDGALYPYAFNYRDFSPVVGQVLQPPPSYQVFQGNGFVVCNFVPRPTEFHPQAIKVPYYHSNVDSDEVMFYFAGETTARTGSGIVAGSVSLHPAGYPHGPVRHAYLDSVGKSEVTEVAFMVDTFQPLALGKAAVDNDDESYPWTWATTPARESARRDQRSTAGTVSGSRRD